MDLRKTKWSGVDWIDLAQDGEERRDLEHGNETVGSCWEILE
jgi:hypothetical protein